MNTPACIYLRVSTDDQSVENQLPDLERLAEARGYVIKHTYSENVSAVKQRPEYERMMNAAHAGKVRVLLVWSLDRLHRSMIGAIQTVLELDRLGVRVVSVREPWLDTSGPVRALLVAIFGWVGEQERLRISDRTRAGLERARRRGVRLGRPGFEIDLVKARALREAGKSFRVIATEMNVSVGKVHEALVGRARVRQTPRKACAAEARSSG